MSAAVVGRAQDTRRGDTRLATYPAVRPVGEHPQRDYESVDHDRHIAPGERERCDGYSGHRSSRDGDSRISSKSVRAEVDPRRAGRHDRADLDLNAADDVDRSTLWVGVRIDVGRREQAELRGRGVPGGRRPRGGRGRGAARSAGLHRCPAKRGDHDKCREPGCDGAANETRNSGHPEPPLHQPAAEREASRAPCRGRRCSGPRRERQSVRAVELREHARDMRLDGRNGEPEPLRDLGIRESVADTVEHAPLGGGQDVGVRRPSTSVSSPGHERQPTSARDELPHTVLPPRARDR